MIKNSKSCRTPPHARILPAHPVFSHLHASAVTRDLPASRKGPKCLVTAPESHMTAAEHVLKVKVSA